MFIATTQKSHMSFITNEGMTSSLLWDQLNWDPSADQLTKFTKLQGLLKHWNSLTNLTKLIDGGDYWINQVLDSLLPIIDSTQKNNNPASYADVGSGCGFPGLAVAIALPSSKITLIESNHKKAEILKIISDELDLKNRISIINQRAEIVGQNNSFRGKFDFAMARAVGSAPIVAEYLMPLINSEGRAILYRGKWSLNDENELKRALNQLNGKIKSIKKFDLPQNRGQRHLIELTPINKCPSKYPRSTGIPKKKPLGN